MGNRVAKPIERLLKIKAIDPNFKFVGADAKAYNEFMKKQEEEKFLEELRKKEAKKIERQAKRSKKVKKVKQVIPEDIVETGKVEFEEAEPVEQQAIAKDVEELTEEVKEVFEETENTEESA